MPATPIYALPYPASSDPADVPLDLQELADRLEALRVPAGSEIAYDQITANVTGASIDPVAPNVVIPGTSKTYDGQPVIAEFSAPMIQHSAGPIFVWPSLWVDGAMYARILSAHIAVANNGAAGYGRVRLTPSAGAHTLSVRVYSSGAGTATIWAGPTGSNQYGPAFLRVIRA